MAHWKSSFQKAVACFRNGRLDDALELFSESINRGGNDSCIYDSRAAVYEKLGKTKEALQDSKKAIDLAPHFWQGYARSARLFLKIGRLDPAQKMLDLAIVRVDCHDVKRHDQLGVLRDQILQAVQERQSQASTSFYHFGKLPLEIATSIFAYVLEDNHAEVISLAQVCQNWRGTILGTPSLWGILILSEKNPVKKVKTWALRSRGRLSELHLRPGLTNQPWALDELRAMPLDFLRSLHIQIPVIIREWLPTLSSTVLCSLNELSVSYCGDNWLWTQPGMKLRVLTIDDSSFDWSGAAHNIKNLEHFSIRSNREENGFFEVLTFLRSNSRLQSLTLRLGRLSPVRPIVDNEDVVCFTQLKQLYIERYDVAMSQMLALFSLTSLRVFRVDGGIHSLDGALAHLHYSGYSASLTELSISRCAVSAGRVLQLLHSTPILESLQFDHVGGNQANKILEALGDIARSSTTSSSGLQEETDEHTPSAVLCPHLRRVNFSHCPDIKSGPLVRLVKSRLDTENSVNGVVSSTAAVASIETLIIDGCPAVDVDILPWLRSKVREVSCIYMTKKDAKRRR